MWLGRSENTQDMHNIAKIRVLNGRFIKRGKNILPTLVVNSNIRHGELPISYVFTS